MQDNSYQSRYNKKTFPNSTNKTDYKPKPKNFKKRKKNCFVCGKLRHHTWQCSKELTNNPRQPNANLVEGYEIITIVISQVNIVNDMKHWAIGFSTTRHICSDKDAFSSYTLVGNKDELVYLRDSQTAKVVEKGKILLKLTSGKTLALNNVLHAPNIQTKLIFVSLLEKIGWKFHLNLIKLF